jgi:hypothetical protein
MIMLLFVHHRKNDFYVRIEALQSNSLEVGSGLEVNAINAWLEDSFGRQQISAPAIVVGRGFVDERPGPILHSSESDGNGGGRASKSGVEDVCRDAHD